MQSCLQLNVCEFENLSLSNMANNNNNGSTHGSTVISLYFHLVDRCWHRAVARLASVM